MFVQRFVFECKRDTYAPVFSYGSLKPLEFVISSRLLSRAAVEVIKHVDRYVEDDGSVIDEMKFREQTLVEKVVISGNLQILSNVSVLRRNLKHAGT